MTPIGQRISYLIFKAIQIQWECYANVHRNGAPMVAGLADKYNRWRQKYILLVTQVFMLAQSLYQLSHFDDHKNAWNGLVFLHQGENPDERRWHNEAHGLACAQIELAIEIREEIAPKPVDEAFRAKQAGFGTAQRTSSVQPIGAGKPFGIPKPASSLKPIGTGKPFATPKPASSPFKADIGTLRRTSSVQPIGTGKPTSSPFKPDFGTRQRASSVQSVGTGKPFGTPKLAPSPLRAEFGSVNPWGSPKSASSPLKPDFGTLRRTSSVQPIESGNPFRAVKPVSSPSIRREYLGLEGESEDFGRFFQSLDEIPVTWGRPPAFDGPFPEADPVRVEHDVNRLKDLLWRQQNGGPV